MNRAEANSLRSGVASAAAGWGSLEIRGSDRTPRLMTSRCLVIDILQALPGQQVFKTLQETDRYLQEERDLCDR
jgi:hypothetical protein